jgi:phosphoribosylanthranilate isomerase
MPKVKICGIRRKDDISFVNKYLPEFIGFIFADSKRKIKPEDAKALLENLDKRIKTVGVFVNEDIKTVVETAEICNLNVVQIHGDEDINYINDLKSELGTKIEIWKAIRVKDEKSLSSFKQFNVNAILLDTYSTDGYGGSGKVFDWHLAAEAGKQGKIVLAGGLNKNNIREAINVVMPYVLDVSSGVETDGFKDEGKIRGFINMVRSYE